MATRHVVCALIQGTIGMRKAVPHREVRFACRHGQAIRLSGSPREEIQSFLYRLVCRVDLRVTCIPVQGSALDHKRLEDRIHALLAKAVDTADAEELESFISDLRSALNRHVKRLREMAASRPVPRRRGTD